MSIARIQEAHRDLSLSRKETVLQTEFAHLMHRIRLLERKPDRYSKDELPLVFGEDADKAIPVLQSTGIIRLDHEKRLLQGREVIWTGSQRKLPRQVDSSKVEFSTASSR